MKKNMLFKISLLAAAMFSVTVAQAQSYPGLNYPKPQVDNPPNEKVLELNELMSDRIGVKNSQKEEVSPMRREALVEIASALGASNGLAHRMKILKADVNTQANQLDRLYDFSQMTIDNGVIAPVLTEGLANYAQESDDQVRIADKIYKIEAPAKFVSVYPTWRTYLRFSFPSFDEPSSAYLPKNDSEKVIWDAAIKEGWEKGVLQANRIFEASYSRLERDYLGMIKYKLLLAQGLITPTIIAKQNFGVTGGGREMSINDQVFRITDHSSLNPNKEDWKVQYPVTNQTNGKLK